MREKIFSRETVNGGRQKELDMAKAVMIFFLAFIHCTIECTPEEELAFGIPYLFDSIIGGPLSAPMYMFAMGVGMAYTRHGTPRDYVRRGIKIEVTGYALNICRFLIPFLIGYLMTGDYGKYIEPLPYRVLGNDILQFAGLAMMLTALLVKLNIPNMGMLCICLAMSVLGTCLNGVDMGTPLGNILLGYLIGTEDAAGKVFSDFPVFNWLLAPVSGYVFGKQLRHVKDKRIFYGLASTIGMAVTLVYFPIGIVNAFGMFGEGQNCYYHITTPDLLASLSAAVGALGIYYAVVRHMPDKLLAAVTEVSRNINVIYCVHWVFVMMGIDVVLYILCGTQELPVAATMAMSLCISVLSILTAHFWRHTKRKGMGGNG